ncbi:MAG: hypothetical protein JW782_07940 [Candidatus Saganbacteria bacterium]|nr:hypothetical protein [Candidatus Saganbacteria bacterium]
MNSDTYIVRIVTPSDKPSLPKLSYKVLTSNKKLHRTFERALNIIIGSLMGLSAGVVAHLALQLVGFNVSGMETSLIISLPSVFGLLASLVIF